MKKYLSLMSNQTKVECTGIIVLALVSSLLSSIWPVRLSRLYTNISNGAIGSTREGVAAVMAFGVIYLLAECIAIVRRVMLDCTIATHESGVRGNIIDKLLKIAIAYHAKSQSGEKTAQLNQGVAGFSQLIKIMCNDVFAAVFMAVCTLAQVFLNAPVIMTALMMIYLILTIVLSVFQIKSQNGIRERIVGKKNALEGQILTTILNLEWIRAIHAEDFEKRRLLPKILEIALIEKRHHRYMGTFDCFKQLCKVSFQVILLVVSVSLTAGGKMSAGSVITICMLFQQLVKPIEEVYRFMDETASSLVKTKALLEIAGSPSDEIFDIRSAKGDIYENAIRIKDVVVTNPEGDKSLAWYEDITIPGGKKVALIGPNGGGKTNLIKGLNRYYPHIGGQIKLFGKSQEAYDQKELTDTLYYTPQTSFFIAGTVRENLLYGIERGVDDKELIDVLEKVHLVGENHRDTVIKKNPMEALECRIGEKAEELSGGMKQRLSLARAFLRKPREFIFDEITANLDQEATGFVLSNIEKYAEEIGAGIIYISHDQAVVDRCDEIIEIHNKLRNKGQTVPFKNMPFVSGEVKKRETA